LLHLATAAGGEALGLPEVGRLRAGGSADFVAFAADGGESASLAAFVHGERRPLAIVRGGRKVALAAAPGR
ncbi:MAG: hypothetical protein WAT39_11730, partial [Planctomycetota bacterium]